MNAYIANKKKLNIMPMYLFLFLGYQKCLKMKNKPGREVYVEEDC
jgi:hypothetical protein